MKATWTLLGAAVLSVAVATTWTLAEEKRRNPFDVPDIEDVDSEATKEYAKKVELKGDKDDPNAEQWVTEATEGKKGSLDGEWHDRWNTTGDTTWQKMDAPAKIKTVGDRVYILSKHAGSTYLVDLKREKDLLVGRYKNLDNASDAGPCVFKIVGDDRLDGDWAQSGRWDFRRKLK